MLASEHIASFVSEIYAADCVTECITNHSVRPHLQSIQYRHTGMLYAALCGVVHLTIDLTISSSLPLRPSCSHGLKASCIFARGTCTGGAELLLSILSSWRVLSINPIEMGTQAIGASGILTFVSMNTEHVDYHAFCFFFGGCTPAAAPAAVIPCCTAHVSSSAVGKFSRTQLQLFCLFSHRVPRLSAAAAALPCRRPWRPRARHRTDPGCESPRCV